MGKKMAVLGTLTLCGAAWCIHRDKKYPLAKGYRLFNKVAVNGAIINTHTVKLENKLLAGRNLPAVHCDLIKDRKRIKTRDNADINLSIYRAKETGKKQPCLVYFHGGGFFLKDEAYIHKNVMKYAIYAKCKVVYVHYRTSDDYPFPIPFYDCCDALQYVWDNAEELNIDKDRIAVGGDSSGGALAASCTHWCKDHQIPLCFQMLIYPVIDSRMNTNTAIQYKDCPLWNSSMSKRMWELYLRDGVTDKEEYASPILANEFNGLPPAFIEVSEYDSLYDEGKNYADVLRSYNIPVELSELKGSIHGFDILENTELTKNAIKKRSEALYNAFYTE